MQSQQISLTNIKFAPFYVKSCVDLAQSRKLHIICMFDFYQYQQQHFCLQRQQSCASEIVRRIVIGACHF